MSLNESHVCEQMKKEKLFSIHPSSGISHSSYRAELWVVDGWGLLKKVMKINLQLKNKIICALFTTTTKIDINSKWIGLFREIPTWLLQNLQLFLSFPSFLFSPHPHTPDKLWYHLTHRHVSSRLARIHGLEMPRRQRDWDCERVIWELDWRWDY